MPSICAVVDCYNQDNRKDKIKSLGRIFHRFPKDADTVKKWIYSCRRADKVNPQTARICSDHFDPSCYDRDLENELLGLPPRKKLKKGSVPTIFPARKLPSEAAVKRNERISVREETRERKRMVTEILKNHEEIVGPEGLKKKSLCMLCCWLFEPSSVDETNQDQPEDDAAKEISENVAQTLAQFGEHALSRLDQPEPSCFALENEEDEEEEALIDVKPGGAILTLETVETKVNAMLQSCQENDLGVCSKCLGIMKAATASRLEATQAEKRVRKLQCQVLKELRCLEGKLKEFYKDTDIVAETLEKADVTCLKMRLSRKQKKSGSSEFEGKNSFSTPDGQQPEQVLQFRRKIVEASKDIELHRGEIDSKIDQDPLECNGGNIKVEMDDDEISDMTSSIKVESDGDTNDDTETCDDDASDASANPTFHCEMCSKSFTFTTKLGLDIHLDAHKSSEEKEQLVCQQCGKSFSLVKWVYHKRFTTCAAALGETFCSMDCEICGKTLEDRELLKQHVRYHQLEGPFTCSVCGKILLFKSNLWRHERQHTGVRPYPCSVCGKAYTNSTTRKRHEMKCNSDKIEREESVNNEASDDGEGKEQEGS